MSYDPNAIISAANAKKAESNWQGGQFLFQKYIMEWTDDAMYGQHNEQLVTALNTLWLAYASYLISSKQFKTAMEAFEEALQSPVVSGRVFLEAARFALERNKKKTAQDIYIRALYHKNVDDQDKEILWQEFWDMMKSTKPDITMEELKQAAAEQAKDLIKNDTEAAKTHVVLEESVLEAAKALQLDDLPPEIMASWLSQDGTFPPQIPPSLFEAAPPKLSDPTAKDILGVDLSKVIVQKLLEHGTVILELCRALWTLQALCEQKHQKRIDAFDKKALEEYSALESELEARLSVAGAAALAVQTMNEGEKSELQNRIGQERQKIINEFAWDLRKTLFRQQRVLQVLKMPSFEEGPTVDNQQIYQQSQVCKYLHSAFYIRSRMGAAPHGKMLVSQMEKLQKTPNAPLSPVPPHPNSPVPPQQQFHQQTHLPPPANFNYPPPPMQPQMMPYGYGHGMMNPNMGRPPMQQQQMPPNQQQPPPPPMPYSNTNQQQGPPYPPPYYQQ